LHANATVVAPQTTMVMEMAHTAAIIILFILGTTSTLASQSGGHGRGRDGGNDHYPYGDFNVFIHVLIFRFVCHSHSY
jgi:hypothetical protein